MGAARIARFKRCVAIIVAATLCASAISLAPAPKALADEPAIEPAPSTNAWDNGYGYDNYTASSASPITSHLAAVDGGYERVEWIEGIGAAADRLVVERYDSAFDIVSQQEIDPSTYLLGSETIWGGYFHGADANYVVTGQNNEGESESLPVVRITKYTSEWAYEDSLEIAGINTVHPFAGGTVRMMEQDGTLHIATCHEMYADYLGTIHQANMYFAVDEASMSLVGDYHGINYYNPYGYASHSFNQFITSLNGTIYTLNQSDANPARGILVNKYTEGYVRPTSIFDFAGEYGKNETGASIGGFESSEAGNSVLAAFASIDQSQWDGRSNFQDMKRSLYLAVVSPSLQASFVKVDTEGSVATPMLVKCSEDRFALLWGEDDLTDDVLRSWDGVHVQLFDGSGNAIGDERFAADADLSNCQPIVADGKVIWYVTGPSSYILECPVFYEFDLATGAFTTHDTTPPEPVEPVDIGSPDVTVSIAPSTWNGSWDNPNSLPELTATYQGERLVEGVDYEVSGGLPQDSDNQIVIGDGTATLTGIGRFTGTRTEAYRIESSCAGAFADMPSDYWALRAGFIDYVNNNGIMTGAIDPDSPIVRFLPDEPITRANVAVVLYRIANPDSTATTDPAHYEPSSGRFSDLPTGPYYYNAAVEWCAEQGIVGGYQDSSGNDLGLFGPDDPVTREQLAKMVGEFARLYGADIEGADPSAYNRMSGHEDVYDFAVPYFVWCADEGVLTGAYVDGSYQLDAKGGATRAQVAKILTVLMRDVLA